MENEISSFVRSGLKQQILDTSIDISEVAIDSITSEGLLQELPGIKIAHAFIKTLTSFRDKNLLKNFYQFLNEFHSGAIDETKKATFLMRLETEESHSARFTECIFLLMDRIDSSFKAQIAARLLKAHMQEYIDWTRFTILCSCVERMSALSSDHLRKFAVMEWADYTNDRNDFVIEERSDLIYCGVAFSHGVQFHINQYGKYIYTYGLIS